MAARYRGRTEPTAKPRNDAYTGLLAISFLAMVGGCVLLYLDYSGYQEQTPPPLPNLDLGPAQPGGPGQPGGPAAGPGMGALPVPEMTVARELPEWDEPTEPVNFIAVEPDPLEIPTDSVPDLPVPELVGEVVLPVGADLSEIDLPEAEIIPAVQVDNPTEPGTVVVPAVEVLPEPPPLPARSFIPPGQ